MSICRRRDPNRKKLAVVVMGPLDRSPRMINHALSAANLTDYYVDLVGYRGQSLPQAVEKNQKIHARYLSTAIID